MVDNASALTVLQTATFRRWLLSLEDERARARVAQRIKRAEMGNLGDIRSVGGDKRTQPADIKRAQRMVQEIGP
jgi:putative component of toxin-antitoxin plasmid stabilization module